MAITLDGANGLFTRLGKIGYAVTVNDEFRGRSGAALATDLPALVKDVMDEFDGGTMTIRELVKNLPDANLAQLAAMSSINSALRVAAQAMLIQMVDDDDPQPARTVLESLAELDRQMRTGAETIKANTVSVTPAAGGSNVGTGILVASIKDGRGYNLEYALAEDVEFDLQSTTTAGAEVWRGRGENAIGDKLSQLWPGGSGSSKTYTSFNATNSANKVSNGGFETFTVANLPDGWVAVTGVAGTDFGSEAALFYLGAKALKYIGGATLTNLTHALTVSGLKPKEPLALNLFTRVSSVPAAGVAVIDLIDGSNNVISDEAGTANTLTVTLTGLTTSYAVKNVVFRLPDPIPSVVKLRIRLTTALSAASNWLIDHLSLATMDRQYASGGPYFKFFTGATNWSGDDLYTAAVANNYAGLFQTFLMRAYDIEQTGLILPSDGAPTIAEALFG